MQKNVSWNNFHTIVSKLRVLVLRQELNGGFIFSSALIYDGMFWAGKFWTGTRTWVQTQGAIKNKTAQFWLRTHRSLKIRYAFSIHLKIHSSMMSSYKKVLNTQKIFTFLKIFVRDTTQERKIVQAKQQKFSTWPTHQHNKLSRWDVKKILKF